MRLEIETAQEYTGVMGLNKVSRHAARAFGQTRFARAVKSCNVTLSRSANQTRICCLSKSNRNPCGGPRLEVWERWIWFLYSYHVLSLMLKLCPQPNWLKPHRFGIEHSTSIVVHVSHKNFNKVNMKSLKDKQTNKQTN